MILVFTQWHSLQLSSSKEQARFLLSVREDDLPKKKIGLANRLLLHYEMLK